MSKFDEWFESHEWFHEDSRRNDFLNLWMRLECRGFSNRAIMDTLDQAISAVRDEYGD